MAPGAGSSRTVGVCVPDPEGVEVLCESLAHVENGEVLVVQDTATALEAAFQGSLDALVVVPSSMTAEALTALSFLQDERPGVTLYALEETKGWPAFRLCPLANFLTPEGAGLEP
jgi:hypothetical protein